ncbi:MAG: ATP-binding protein [Thermodesulfobacteriota bacterium]
MKELALHILDVAENGISAGADRIEITVEEVPSANRLSIGIADNGGGIAPDVMERVTDPFYTTRTTRRVGLGLSLLQNAATQCNGTMTIDSEPGKGTRIAATFARDHIDRAPLGDMAGTLMTLIFGHPEVEITYCHRIDGKEIIVDTMAIKAAFDHRPVTDPDVMQHVMAAINQLKTRKG